MRLAGRVTRERGEAQALRIERMKGSGFVRERARELQEEIRRARERRCLGCGRALYCREAGDNNGERELGAAEGGAARLPAIALSWRCSAATRIYDDVPRGAGFPYVTVRAGDGAGLEHGHGDRSRAFVLAAMCGAGRLASATCI